MTTAIVLKGYPRLSETFIAQEILALQRAGLDLGIVSLRHPTDSAVHPVHRLIDAPVNYLPEYLWREPIRVLRCWRRVRRLETYAEARRAWRRDLARDPTPNRIRRWGQALVLAAELGPEVDRLYAHFLHTPSSVARYASTLRRHSVVRFGARRRYLDHPRMGIAGKARQRRVGADLHQGKPGIPVAPCP